MVSPIVLLPSPTHLQHDLLFEFPNNARLKEKTATEVKVAIGVVKGFSIKQGSSGGRASADLQVHLEASSNNGDGQPRRRARHI